jgi:hypothetical protein
MPYWVHITRKCSYKKALRSFITLKEAEAFIDIEIDNYINCTNERPVFSIYYGADIVSSMVAGGEYEQ